MFDTQVTRRRYEMSAAPQLPPEVFIPEQARRSRRVVGPHRLSVVTPGRLDATPPRQGDVVGNSDWSATSWHRCAQIESRASADPVPLLASSAVRVTRRGAVALGLLGFIAAGGIGLAAWASAPAATARPAAPATVTVQPGDTLWSIALDVAPNHDPRAEVDQLAQLNHLGQGSLSPGQVLRTR
jgi:nucleoid-associated protein YgaU